MLVCEQAGRVIPATLGNRGLLQDKMTYDIGAGQNARNMAEILAVPLALQPDSRLVIDRNRSVASSELIPVSSDGLAVPGNCTLTSAERQKRDDEIFNPCYHAVSALLYGTTWRSIFCHSLLHARSWTGLPTMGSALFRKDTVTPKALAGFAGELNPTIRIGMNAPYIVSDQSDWFVSYH